MILGNFITPINYSGMYFGLFDTLKPLLLGDNPNVSLSFLLGWGVTITAGLMSYPIGRSTTISYSHSPLLFRHHQEAHDDDLWRRCQVQGLH